MKKQYKYHVFKKSLIKNWTKLNGDVSPLKNFKASDHLMVFDSEDYIPSLSPSNTDHFCIIHSENNIKELDDLEKILNRPGGPENEIDKLVDSIKEISIPDNQNGYVKKFTTNKWTLRTLQFWRERWETIVESSFGMLINNENKLEKYTDPRKNILAHIDSQFNSLFKLGYINDEDLPSWFDKKNLEDKWVDEHHKWEFNEENSEIFIHISGKDSLPTPLLGDPVFLTTTNGEPIFFMQLTPNHTIFVINKCSDILEEVEEYGVYSIFWPYIQMGRSYKIFIPFFGEDDFDNVKLIDYTNLLVNITEQSNTRRIAKLFMLTRDSSEKTKFVYDATMAISNLRKYYKIDSLDKKQILIYGDGRRSLLLFPKDSLDDYEKKINSIVNREEVIDIHIRESSKISKRQLTRDDIYKDISHFNFNNTYSDEEI